MPSRGAAERALTRLGIEFETRGAHVWARCPFHDDKHPSWRMRVVGDYYERGLHHCFACKAGGNLVSLVQHRLGLDEDQAIEWLGGRDEEPEEVQTGVRLEVEPLVHVGMQPPRGVRVIPLDDWTTLARDYAERRGIDAQQVARWRIGYAVSGWLGGRIVIPVYDARGAYACFHARAFLGQEPRYLYPRNDDKPDLDAIFGEEKWVLRQRVVVCEGAINALAVERACGGNVAAFGGSGVRGAHLAKLSAFREVVVFTDNDAAGNRAADIVVASLTMHTRVFRATLPNGADAASVSAEEVRAAVEGAARV